MKRRLKWALALSVVLHAVLVGLWRGAPEQPLRPVEPPAQIQFEVVEAPAPLEAEKPAEVVPAPARDHARGAPRPSAPPAAVAQAPKPAEPPAAVAQAPKPVAPAAEVTQAPKPAEPPVAVAQAPKPSAPLAAITQPAPGAAESALQDSPRGAILVPRQSVLPPPVAQSPKGQTIRNRPEELPDPAALLAYEAEVVHKRVDGWAKQTLAKTRVENGVVSYYFHDLRHRLEDVTKEPPPFIEPFGLDSLPKHGEQAVAAWSAAAKRYGATGSAYEQPPGYRRDSEVPTKVQEAAANGSTHARDVSQRLEAGARLRDFGDGRMGEELIAIVEVKQGSNGALADLSLISPSSSARFDTWVMAQAPKALDGKVVPPDAGVGIHADGMRSVWAFKGRVTYKRNMKETKLLEDGWYLALMAVPGMLTGGFDEVTGKVEYIDLRHPKYECRVQLLEVY